MACRRRRRCIYSCLRGLFVDDGRTAVVGRGIEGGQLPSCNFVVFSGILMMLPLAISFNGQVGAPGDHLLGRGGGGGEKEPFRAISLGMMLWVCCPSFFSHGGSDMASRYIFFSCGGRTLGGGGVGGTTDVAACVQMRKKQAPWFGNARSKFLALFHSPTAEERGREKICIFYFFPAQFSFPSGCCV